MTLYAIMSHSPHLSNLEWHSPPNAKTQGDRIYMFGFSRGAFTAKFLARMIHTVGLLCKGNEEMVPFAYRLYQRYLAGDVKEFHGGRHRSRGRKGSGTNAQQEPATNGAGPSDIPPSASDPRPTATAIHDDEHPSNHGRDEIAAFSNTFCRKEQVIHRDHVEEQNIKVYFLGMWDCVNSVAVLESSTPVPVAVKGTAVYVRHAVAVDERRVKFKAALLAQDIRAAAAAAAAAAAEADHNRQEEDDNTSMEEDIKEVWFPGCHGDVGGGWPAAVDNPLDTRDEMTIWQRITNFWTTRKAGKNAATKYLDAGPFQMSDIPLAWMIREAELVGEKDPSAALKWKVDLLERFKRRYHKKKGQALSGFIHDSLAFGCGTGFSRVLLWKFLGESSSNFSFPAFEILSSLHGLGDLVLTETEWLPTITRWELEGDGWRNVRFPLNKGSTRDIPPDAVLHASLLWRLQNDPSYHPKNNHGGKSAPCLKHEGRIPDVKPAVDGVEESDQDHQTYRFSNPSTVG